MFFFVSQALKGSQLYASPELSEYIMSRINKYNRDFQSGSIWVVYVYIAYHSGFEVIL